MIDILVVDELYTTVIELKNELKEFKISLIGAKSEIEAISVLHNNKNISLILWVLNSTNFLLFEKIKDLAGKDISRNLPIIVVSKYADKSYILKAIEHGVKEFIIKPFNQETLYNKLSKFIKIEKKDQRLLKISDEGGNVVYSIFDILSKEIKAASRGNYKLSLILTKLEKVSDSVSVEPDEILSIYIKLIKTKIRETDIVIPYIRNSVIVILPFADSFGVKVVMKKFSSIHSSHSRLNHLMDGYHLLNSYVCFPDDGKTKDLLIEALEKQLKRQIQRIHNF